MTKNRKEPGGFISLLNQVADIEGMIVAGLTEEMPCKKKHVYREQAFRQAASLATTYFLTNQPHPAPGAKEKR